MALETTKWDVVDHLKTDEDIANVIAYLKQFSQNQ